MEHIGIVKDVLTIGESAVLVVENAQNRKEVLVPLSRGICVDVDPAQKRIVIDPPDGLLDLNEI
jgi:ribosomal 30S subunit maturation factor RimM